jgi:hypothetical protein
VPDLSGLKKKRGSEIRKSDIQTYRLDHLMKMFKIRKIDLLSVDTEGTEIDVLNSFDIRKVKPKIIIVEFITTSKINKDIKKYFEQFKDIYKLEKIMGANYLYRLRK